MNYVLVCIDMYWHVMAFIDMYRDVVACIDIYTPKKPRIHESCIEINTCQYTPLHTNT